MAKKKTTEAAENGAQELEQLEAVQEPTAEESPQEGHTDAQEEAAAITLDELDDMTLPGYCEDPDAPAPVWRIADDGCADWALKKIKAEKDELDRLTELGKAEIARITEKLERAQRRYNQNTDFLTSKLAEYFGTVEHKVSKSGTESYRLLNGQLTMKPAGISPKPQNEQLVKWLKDNGYTDYVKVEESPRWGDLKKQLTFVGTVATIADTGELVDGIDIEQTPPQFSIKF